jgi:hypothetical protein
MVYAKKAAKFGLAAPKPKSGRFLLIRHTMRKRMQAKPVDINERCVAPP